MRMERGHLELPKSEQPGWPIAKRGKGTECLTGSSKCCATTPRRLLTGAETPSTWSMTIQGCPYSEPLGWLIAKEGQGTECLAGSSRCCTTTLRRPLKGWASQAPGLSNTNSGGAHQQASRSLAAGWQGGCSNLLAD